MPSTSNVLCSCGIFMRVKKNSVTVEELLDDGSPYRLWSADLYECPSCAASVITGFGYKAFAEHFQGDYARTRKQCDRIYPGR